MSDAPNGSWMDKWGACRVCGGELPHGHSNNCDYYKLELEARAAKQKSELASPAGSAGGNAIKFRFTTDAGSAALYYGDEFVAKFNKRHRDALEPLLSQQNL